jgi:hypothetical protein
MFARTIGNLFRINKQAGTECVTWQDEAADCGCGTKNTVHRPTDNKWLPNGAPLMDTCVKTVCLVHITTFKLLNAHVVRVVLNISYAAQLED